MANQIFCFQIKRTPWMAQFMVQFFPDCMIRVRSFCSTISQFFHQSAWKFFQRPQIALALQVHAILLVFEKIYSCLFIPNCTQNHLITYTNTPKEKVSGIGISYLLMLISAPFSNGCWVLLLVSAFYSSLLEFRHSHCLLSKQYIFKMELHSCS